MSRKDIQAVIVATPNYLHKEPVLAAAAHGLNVFCEKPIALSYGCLLYTSPSNGADTMKSFILPIVTLALPGAAEILRLTRSTMLEVIRQDYIRTARADVYKRQPVCGHSAGLSGACSPSCS